MKIYITQFGFWWSATPKQWRKICELGAADLEFDLDEVARPLADRPAGVYAGSKAAFSYKYKVKRPLDWEYEDWTRELADAE